MSTFPNTPTDGELATVANVTYRYSSANNSWTRQLGLPGNLNVGNIISTGFISAAGNITGNYILGNGSQLTGIVSGGNSFSPIVVSGQSNVTANSISTALTYVAGYGVVINTDNSAKSISYSLDQFAIGGSFGTVTESVTASQDLGLVTEAVTVSYDLGTTEADVNFTAIASDLIPAANVTYDLGNATNQWRDLYMSGNTIFIGGGTISANEAGVTITSPGGAEFAVTGNSAANTIGEFGSVSATGNITGNYILGNGSQLTGISTGTGPVLINEDTVTANLTIAAGQNGFSVGPMTTANGVQVTVADGQRWIIL